MTKLEVKVNGEVKGTVDIHKSPNWLSIITTNNILSNGDWGFTEEAIRELIMKKVQNEYLGQTVEIIPYSAEDHPQCERRDAYLLKK